MPPHMSLTITKMDSTAQFSCAPFSERSQEIEIQVIVLTQGMYVSPVFYKKEHFGEVLGGFTGSTIYDKNSAQPWCCQCCSH